MSVCVKAQQEQQETKPRRYVVCVRVCGSCFYYLCCCRTLTAFPGCFIPVVAARSQHPLPRRYQMHYGTHMPAFIVINSHIFSHTCYYYNYYYY